MLCRIELTCAYSRSFNPTGDHNMKSAVLSVVFLAGLVEFTSNAASAQRGLSNGPSPDPSSGPSDTMGAQESANLHPGQLFPDCDNCPELVVVPPGDFVMGSND